MSAQTSRHSSPGSTQRDRVHLSPHRSRARQRPSKRKHGLCAQVGRHDGIERAAFPHIIDEGQREGVIATQRAHPANKKQSPDSGHCPVTLDEIGVTSQRLAEARLIRDIARANITSSAAARRGKN